MSEDWATVASFNQHHEAALAKSVLESVGIFCWLRDEHVVSLYGIAVLASGGIKLQVRPEDMEAAREALRQDGAVPAEGFSPES